MRACVGLAGLDEEAQVTSHANASRELLGAIVRMSQDAQELGAGDMARLDDAKRSQNTTHL